MATELDRAYIINGDDLRIALERAAIAGEEAAPRVAADILGKFAKPFGDSRWPMTRGELTTRLSLALERASIAVQKDEYRGGTVWSAGNVKTWVTALCPGDLAAALVHDIDRQDADVAAHCRPATSVTVEQLAGWFREHKLTVTQQTGSLRAKVAAPEAIAESILEDITGQAHPMPAEAEIAEPEPCTCPVPTEKCLRGCTGEPVRKRGYYDGKTGMQPFDVIDEFGLDFYEGNCIKYIVRWRKKNGVADLRKARTYIDALIKRAEAQSEGDE